MITYRPHVFFSGHAPLSFPCPQLLPTYLMVSLISFFQGRMLGGPGWIKALRAHDRLVPIWCISQQEAHLKPAFINSTMSKNQEKVLLLLKTVYPHRDTSASLRRSDFNKTLCVCTIKAHVLHRCHQLQHRAVNHLRLEKRALSQLTPEVGSVFPVISEPPNNTTAVLCIISNMFFFFSLSLRWAQLSRSTFRLNDAPPHSCLSISLTSISTTGLKIVYFNCFLSGFMVRTQEQWWN